MGATVFSAHFLLQTWALEFTSATNTGWIVAVSPLTIALLAALVLKEPIPPAMRLGLAIATFGIVLLVSRGELVSLDWLASLGDWLALVSTLTWATYTIVTRDLSRARDPVVVALAMTLPLGAAALVLPWVLDGWRPLATLPAEVMGALVFLGLGGVAIALLLLSVWLMERMAPFSLRKEIEEDHNVAAAIVIGAIVIGVSLVIAAVARG